MVGDNLDDRLPEEQWSLYRTVMRRAGELGLRFAVGGGFANNFYTGGWRNTKDLDLFILKQDREAMIAVLSEAGMTDYFEEKPYDRKWIYRGHTDDLIVDLIWAMANQRANVDELWLEHGPVVEVAGEPFRLVPPEEILWTKLYVMQRERCDWPDALNLLQVLGPDLNWPHLIARVGEDADLLAGLLSVFRWLSPERALELPKSIWERLGIPSPVDEGQHADRAPFLDTRPWLAKIPTHK